jgi:histidinol-phosphate aminotransferase
MGKWLKARISSLSRISGYQKPARFPRVLRMDTNENLVLPRKFVSNIVKEATIRTDLREYPTEQFDELRHQLSTYLKVPKECIAVGNGSDQIIDLLLATFGGHSAATVTVKPTFTFYKDRCDLHSIRMKEVKLNHDFSLDAKKLLSVRGAKICYICSPNNPTGNQFERQTMLDVIGTFNGLVIVDEAYVEFADYSLKDLVRKHDNLVVLRTMSKAFGLAGARVGYMVANKKIAEMFVSTIQYPYAVSSISLKTASLALSRFNYVKSIINQVKKEREMVYENIKSLGVTAFSSDANFVLFEVGKRYKAVREGLIRKGVLVRDIGNIDGHNGCLRVTVGTKSMNSKFLESLKVVCR